VKIFFFTTVFSPSVGGIERLAETLCAEFVALGHEVRLATTTPGKGTYPYPVIRRPGLGEFLGLLRWCDVHVQANVALKFVWPRLLFARKTVFQHNCAYEQDDGSWNLFGRAKVALAKHSRGIANSHYTSERIGIPDTVLNAYDDAVFRNTRPWAHRDRDLVFLGRLVSQKGCDTLLRALRRLRARGLRPRLTVIGDGPERDMLGRLCSELGLKCQVQFVGAMTGTELAVLLNRHKVMVVPSIIREPFGIVALEGLASGCVPVVSERGGLVDAIGGHGFTFPNGNDAALARVLVDVLTAPDAARARLDGMAAQRLDRQLDQRRFQEVPWSKIRLHPARELVRQIRQEGRTRALVRHETGWASVDAVYAALDRAVAASLRRSGSEVRAVYAYEDGALETFRAARQVGLKRLYDLPIAHWRTLHRLLSEEAERLPEWAPTMQGLRDSAAKHARKDEEIASPTTFLSLPASPAAV
jgi:glycogen synthase